MMARGRMRAVLDLRDPDVGVRHIGSHEARMVGRSPIMIAVLEALTDEDLEAFATILAPHLKAARDEEESSAADCWMGSSQAASYLGITSNALYKLTARRAIPFEQDGPGCRLWFKRPDLDRWRRGGGTADAPACGPR